MKIILIGNSGSGKSTLARKIQAQTGWPLLALDRIWHAMDYGDIAKMKFKQVQRQFMAQNQNWIIDGNYASTLPLRLPQADLVLVLQVPRALAVLRVIRRSLRFRRDPASRTDMAPGFQEHFDREYFDFLKYVWHYQNQMQEKIAPQLAQLRPDQQVVYLRSRRQKQALLKFIAAKKA